MPRQGGVNGVVTFVICDNLIFFYFVFCLLFFCFISNMEIYNNKSPSIFYTIKESKTLGHFA